MNEFQIKNIKTHIFWVHNIVVLILLLLLLISSVSAQVIKSKLLNESSVKFEKSEWNIELLTNFENPFWEADVALNMEINTPSGNKLFLPCFYVRGESGEISLWKARFTPRETGKYRYRFVLNNKGEFTAQSKKMKFEVSPSKGKGFLSLNDDWTFKFDNGDLFRGIGENICWETRSNDNSKFFKELHENPKYNYDYMLGQLAANGGNYFRVWMCSWNLPLEWKKVSNNTNRYANTTEYFNPDAIKRMDELVELCDSLEIYMMLCIDQSGNYQGDMATNNYYIKNGGFATNAKEFLTLDKSKEQYKNRLRYLIARWGYSPCIGAWEFFNEIDYLGYGQNDSLLTDMHEAIVNWHEVMSTYLKENDPYQHLITTSVSHRDIQGLNEVENIDFNQKHIYKQTEIIPAVINEYRNKFHKPYVIGEFGYEWDWSLNFNDVSDEMDSDYKHGLWLGLFNPTPILPLSWWWEFFEDRGLLIYFNNVREIYNNMIAAGNGKFKSVKVSTENKKVESYAVICENKLFINLFNTGKEIKKLKITIENKNISPDKAQLYNCETGEYHSIKDFSIQNQTFQSSEIILLNKSDLILILYLDDSH